MSHPTQPLKALLLDDDTEQAYLLARMLTAIDVLDVDLIHYSRMETAMADLLSEKADLVFLDHHLSGEETGLDLLRSLRDTGFDGPIVMLTGRDDKELVDDFRRFGADAYVHKADLDPHRVFEAIQVALKLPHKLVPRILAERKPRP